MKWQSSVDKLHRGGANMMNWLWKRIIKRRHLHRVRFDQLKIGDIVRLKGAYWKVVMFNGPNRPVLGKVERPTGD